jgi:hypothetical protein
MAPDPAQGRHRYLVGLGMSAWWKRAVIAVWDFTAAYWRPYLPRTIVDFNAKLPHTVPRLEYIEMSELACDRLPP